MSDTPLDPLSLPDPPAEPTHWRQWARRAIDEALAVDAVRLEPVPHGFAPYPDRIRIDDFHVSRALRCAAGRAAEKAEEIARDEPLEPTPRKVRRSLACAAAKKLSAQPERALLDALRETMSPEHLDGWATRWLDSEPAKPERVLAAANAAATVAEWLHLPWPLEGSVNDTRSWEYPERPLRLTTRLELVKIEEDLATAHRLAVSDDHRFQTDELAYTAVVCLLGGVDPPLELVVHYPATGQRPRRLRTSPDLLRRGIEVARLAVATEATARRLVSDALPRQPGPGCRRCPLAVECEPGSQWLDGPGRRRQGLPPLRTA